MIKANLTTMIASGARIVLGTNAGIRATYGFGRLGTLTAGKNADFIVLNANPLDDIENPRHIAAGRGAKLDRDAMLAKWKKAGTSQ